MDLRKLRGVKGCQKCPGHLEVLAKALEQTAYNRHAMGETDWERTFERAVGVRLAIGILKHGVDKEGNVQADLPCPPNIQFEEWKNGPRFVRGLGFNDAPEHLMTNPNSKMPREPIVPGPARKPKPRKQGTARKGGMKVISIKELKKRREQDG